MGERGRVGVRVGRESLRESDGKKGEKRRESKAA